MGSSPLLLNFWGHIPQTPWEGAAPPPPPVQCRGVATLRPYLAQADLFSKRLTSVGVKGAHPPAPLDPPLPTPVGLGFANVLGPTRCLVAKVGSSPPLFGFVGGHPPRPPAMGASPPGPPFAHPRGLRVRQSFGSHSWRVCQGGQLAPSFWFCGGDTPHAPRQGASPPGPPFAHPRGLRVCQRFGSHSWRGC